MPFHRPRPEQFAPASSGPVRKPQTHRAETSPNRRFGRPAHTYHASDEVIEAHRLGRLASPEQLDEARHNERLAQGRKLPATGFRSAADLPPSPWRPNQDALPFWSSERPDYVHSYPESGSQEIDFEGGYDDDDLRYGALSDELRKLDNLSAKLSGRRARRQEGVTQPGHRRREMTLEMSKTYPLQASYNDYQRRLGIVSREAAAKREDITSARSRQISQGADPTYGLNELKKIDDWEKRMEEDLATGPHGAKALRDGDQLAEYSFARQLARERGRYPEKNPSIHPSMTEGLANSGEKNRSTCLPMPRKMLVSGHLTNGS